MIAGMTAVSRVLRWKLALGRVMEVWKAARGASPVERGSTPYACVWITLNRGEMSSISCSGSRAEFGPVGRGRPRRVSR